jgi:hypothetical protein
MILMKELIMSTKLYLVYLQYNTRGRILCFINICYAMVTRLVWSNYNSASTCSLSYGEISGEYNFCMVK